MEQAPPAPTSTPQGRLAHPLVIDIAHGGTDVAAAPFARLDEAAEALTEAGAPICIRRARERTWCFPLAGSSWLSRPKGGSTVSTSHAPLPDVGEVRS